MRNRLKLLRTLAFAAGITGALMFGTTQALASIGCSEPITACKHYQEPDLFCNWFCDLNYGYGGICNTGDDCCFCFEK
jgi:hypothetical protein